MSEKVIIKHCGKEYEVDVERAKSLGVLKELITINVGDVYEYPIGGVRVCFIQLHNRVFNTENRFVIIGARGLAHYSDAPFGRGMTNDECADWIKEHKLRFVRNINNQVSNLIND